MIDGASIIFNSDVLISLCGELAKHLSLLCVVAVTRPAPYLWEQQGPRSEVTVRVSPRQDQVFISTIM